MALNAALALEVPTLVAGRYRVGRRIGQGSIAQVVEARDESTGAVVALKILFPSLQSNQVVADRFRREVQVVRRIAHRHVIAIHDVVEDAGLLFLVMELHAGGDLADRIARTGPLDPDELRALSQQLCGALEAAHRAGVVHRDVKPQNVLVGPDPGQLDTRLCDFGLARTVDLAGLTTRSTVLGTPEYMAPEIVSDGYADPRSDIYSLGVVLFEAATGRLPFRADSAYQLMRRHLTDTPPRAATLHPELPAEIDVAIARALSKEPLDRFASAADFAEALSGAGAPSVRPAAAGPLRGKSLETRTTCRRCGGPVVRLAQICVDCGARSLNLRTMRRGRAVLVTGPGEIGDKLDGASHVALVKLLEEVTPEMRGMVRLRKRPPRLPFFVAGELEEPSADELTSRLRDLGFEARVERRASLRPREVRRKAWNRGRHAFLPFFGLGCIIADKVFGQAPYMGELGFWMGPALVGVTGLIVPALVFRRPLVTLAAGSEGAGPLVGLGQWLGRIKRREDRRLVARILDRLQLAEGLGARDAVGLLAGRAELACRGLAALDDGVRHLDETDLRRAVASGRAGDDVTAALDSLREAERRRGVMVADLLRTFSRADQLCVSQARIEGLAAGEQAASAARELASLKSELEAEEDVAGLLA